MSELKNVLKEIESITKGCNTSKYKYQEAERIFDECMEELSQYAKYEKMEG